MATEASIFTIAQIESLPVTATQIAKAICKDSVLSKVFIYTQQGWPKAVEDCLLPFQRCQYELTVEAGCLL